MVIGSIGPLRSFDGEAVDAGEVSDVVCHHRIAVGHRDGGDQRVIEADRLPMFKQSGEELGVNPGGAKVEGQDWNVVDDEFNDCTPVVAPSTGSCAMNADEEF